MTKGKVQHMKYRHKTKAVKIYPTGYVIYACPECDYLVVVGNGKKCRLVDGDSDTGHSGGIGGLEITGFSVEEAEDSGLTKQWFEESGFSFEKE